MPTIFDPKTGKFIEVEEKIIPPKFTRSLTVEVVDGKDGEKGEKGDRGERGERGDRGESGKDGRDGKDGKNGETIVGKEGISGKDGADGVGIVAIKQETPETACITLTDGTEYKIILPAGKDGDRIILGRSQTHIQWRYESSKEWFDLFPIPKNTRGGGGGGVNKLKDLFDIDLTGLANGNSIVWNAATNQWEAGSGGGGSGTVTSVSVTTANGISGTVATATTTPAISLDISGLDASKIADGSVSSTEFQYINTLSSNAQTQIDGKQPLDSDLTTIAGLTATTDNFLQSKSSAWASRTPTQVTADLIAMVGDSGSGGTKGLVPAPAAGDAAAGKFLKADGTWTAAGGGSPAFSDITGATNTTAAMVVGTGASLATSGSGTIAATSVTNATLTTALTVNTGTLTLTANAANNSVLTIGAGAVSVSGSNTGDQTTVSGNAGTVTFVDAGGDTTTFVALGTAATGSLSPATDAGLTYNATTNALTTTTFIGALTGNADTATTSTSATTATNITLADEATDTTCFLLFGTAATGNLGAKTNTALTFNSNTASLGCTTFVGALTGNVTGNVSGSAATVTTAAQPAITSLGTLTTLTVDDITINGNTISSAGASTLAITPTAGQSITFDGTVTLDAGVIAGATSITSTTFVGALTGNASTATSATVSTTSTIANEATDTSCFVNFTTAATGDLGLKSNASLTFNSNTANLGCTTFTGALVGNASTATSAATLTTPRTIGGTSFDGSANIVPDTINSVNEATDTTCFPLFITASGTQALQPKNNTALTFNSNTGTLGATTFSGAGTSLTGTASGLTAGNVTTNANLTGVVTSSGNATSFGVFTSAQLEAACADANGSGELVFATSPTLTTPVLGVATATSINKVTFTAPATSATITATNGTTTTLSGGTQSGTNTGDQTITLTGAVTGTGTGSFATTIATPGTLTVSSTNSTATAHTHAITSSSAPGAAASLLATDSSGIIGSTGTRIVKGWFTDLQVTNSITGSITGNAATVTTNANLTGAVTSTGNATSQITGIWVATPSTVALGNVTLTFKMPFGGTVNKLYGAQTTSGTFTWAWKINGTNITGLSAVAVSSTPADTNATAANTFSTGDIITAVSSSASSDLGASATLQITRT